MNSTYRSRLLAGLKLFRIFGGVAACVAMAMVVISGFTALARGDDTSLAIKLPFFLAVLLLSAFVGSTRTILGLEARLRADQKPAADQRSLKTSGLDF